VFDRAADLSPQLTLVRTTAEIPTFVIVSPSADAGRIKRLEAAGVTVLRVDALDDALQALHRLGIRSLLVEGGGQLAGALLGAGLVNRYYWLQSPLWLGDEGVPALAGLPSKGLEQAQRWKVIERRVLGEDSLLVLDCP
jgi:diaminohydroxyphosphoribosylaminopyrimidine deaminase/5-amino-6-(5-phosphoribosylamino)uracil reductase